ncbi:MAG: DoxX family protein [Candidatus Acidiferrum sp.]
MAAESQTMASTKKMMWAGRAISTFVVLFLVLDSTMKLVRLPMVLDAFKQLGYSPDLSVTIGTMLLLCTVIYVVPQTAVLGAILLTGYLGGAVATNLRIGAPMFSHILFPVYMGAMVWGGLYLRDGRLRELVPVKS